VCGVLRTRTDLTAALFDREPAAATEDPPVVAIDALPPMAACGGVTSAWSAHHCAIRVVGLSVTLSCCTT